MTEQEFINMVLPVAREFENKYGIPAIFAVAQWALESKYGKSAPGYNFMGIKAGSTWKGKKQYLWTWEAFDSKDTFKKYAQWKPETLVFKNKKWYAKVKTYFRAYDSFRDAADDWAQLITGKNYRAAFQHTNDPVKFAQAIKDAKYATGANYVQSITAIMNNLKSKYSI